MAAIPGRRGGRVVAGAVEAERPGDPVAQQHVQGAAGDLLEHQLERDHVQVRVQVRRAGVVHRRLVVDEPDPLLVRGRAVQRDPGPEARGMGEQLTDRHALLARPSEVRQIRGDRRLQLQRAPLQLLHGEDRGEQLGDRREVEHRVLGHRDLLPRGELHTGVGLLVVGPVAHRHADRLVQRHRAAPAGQQHGPRVPGVPGRRGEERLGVGDQPAQMAREQSGALGRPAPESGTAALVRDGRGRTRRERGDGQGAAQGQGPGAQLTPRPSVRRLTRHRRASRRRS